MWKKTMTAMCIVALLTACGGGKNAAENSETATVPEVQVAAETPSVAELGKGIYSAYCSVCHQATGMGMPGSFPPLQSDWVTGDKDRLIGIVLNGLQGEIEVNGEKYDGVMAPHNFLKDEEVAAVLTYIRSNFGNDASSITAEEVAAVRK